MCFRSVTRRPDLSPSVLSRPTWTWRPHWTPGQLDQNHISCDEIWSSDSARIVPPLSHFQFTEKTANQQSEFVRVRTTTQRPQRTTTRSLSVTTTRTAVSSRDELVHRVMSMDPPELADALMDPMMMAMGTMLAMSGAYMAMTLQETAAANALSLALGGKKKKK